MKKVKNLPLKISDLISFYNYKRKKNKINSGKIIYFNIRKPNLYSRYLYLLIKFFHIEGYRIYLPNTVHFFRKIRNSDIYLSLLLKESLVEFKYPIETCQFLEINDDNLSPEYFSFLITGNQKNCYHIPMSLHPLLYYKDLWNKKIPSYSRKRSVFMIGNFEPETYNSLEFPLFKVYSRTQIYNTLKEHQVLFEIESQSELEEFLSTPCDGKFIIIDRNDFTISIEYLRNILSQFYFFLACPGVVIPHSHNLIEALSVGCIPIIQENYAQLMHPPLRHMHNAITFTNTRDIEKVMNLAINLDLEELELLQQNVYKYYNTYLTPKAVIREIMEKQYSKIYLQAEFDSVRHLKLQIAYKKAGKEKPRYA